MGFQKLYASCDQGVWLALAAIADGEENLRRLARKEKYLYLPPDQMLGTRPVGGTSHLLRAEVTRHSVVRWREGLYAGWGVLRRSPQGVCSRAV